MAGLAGTGLLAACGDDESSDSNASASESTSASGSASDGTSASDSSIDSIGLDEPIEITFWHIQATLYGEAVKDIVASFNEDNPYNITVREVFQGDYGALNQKLRAALQGGGLPDVSMAYESDTLEYMKADVVVPLDDYIASEEYGLTDAEIDDISPGVLARQRIPAYEGKTMSWPHGNSSQGMYYNIDILSQAGIDTPAETWEQFLEQGRRLKSTSDVPLLASGSGPGGLLQNIMRSHGVEPLTDDGTTSNYDAPEVVAALELIKQMFDEGIAYTAEDTEQEFTNGRAAIEIGTTARTSSKIELIEDKFQWGITLTPQGTAEEPITALYGGNQVMFDKDDARRHLASWLFLRYFASSEGQAIYAARTGYFPATLSAKDTELLKENYQQYPQKQQAFEEVFPHARIYQPSAAGNSINQVVSDQTTAVILGRTTPAEAAAEMKREADRLLTELAS